MAAISKGQVRIGIIPGSTWGTAAAISGAQLLHGRYSISNARGEFTPVDVGFSNFVSQVIKMEETVEVTINARLAFNSLINQPITMMMGQDTATETTGGQGDYAHVIKLDEENDGEFFTMVCSYGSGSTEVLEFPSVKPHTLRVSHQVNNVAEVTIIGIADRIVVSSATNALTALTGATYPDTFADQAATLNGTNAYFRMNTQSGSALDSGDDLTILGYDFEIVRPLARDFVLRGANSIYTVEPLADGIITGRLNVNFQKINSSEVDLLSHWANETNLKAEIFFDGAAIGSGVNRSYKFMFPSFEHAGGFPVGFDAPDNAGRMRPVGAFTLKQAETAPSGMTGHTNYLGWTAISTRVAAWT